MPEPFAIVLDDLARESADLVSERIEAAIDRRGLAAIVLAGGSTPNGLYQRLASPQFDHLAWDRIHAFWGDERLVPPDDAGSNFAAARPALLDRVGIPPVNIHRIRGELSPHEAVADYTQRLRQWALEHDPGAPNPWPRFDLVLLGLGDDGHTASLFPGSPVEVTAPVIAVTADYQGRPAGRVTLTPPVFNDARSVLFLVSGTNKANAVYDTFYTDDPARFPAQRIRIADEKERLWLLDKGAASRLVRRDHRSPG